MELSDYVDIEKLRASIENRKPRDLLFHWAETARDVAPARIQMIGILFGAYNECSDHELRPQKLLGYFEALLQELANDDARRQFLQAEAPGATKWERWTRQ